MKCPHCKKTIPQKLIAKAMGAKGGAAGTGKKKARSSEQARAAINARWAKVREQWDKARDDHQKLGLRNQKPPQ